MAFYALVLVGLTLTILIGSVCGLIAISKFNGLRRQVDDMKRRLDAMANASAAANTAPVQDAVARPPLPASQPVEPVAMEPSELEPTETEPTVEEEPEPERPAPIAHPTPVRPPRGPSFIDSLAANVQTHWMTWLGGACVSLAGIMLVRYSMDRGWLGPLARILLALATGAALLASAEYLRRRDGRSQPALAALAGAGSITLYGALLAAMRLYELISPTTAFVLMAIVAIGTMALALLHGPLLAAFGILGAYLVPVLVSTGSGGIVIALGYALVVSLSALLLMRHVYRPWLWWGFVAGAMGWWLISLDINGADGVRTLYLTALAYLMAAAPTGDWWLRRLLPVDYAGYDPREFVRSLTAAERNLVVTYVGMACAVGINIVVTDRTSLPWVQGLPFFALSLLLARRRDAMFVLPWVTLLATIAGWLMMHVESNRDTFELLSILAADSAGFLLYLFGFGVLAAGASLWLFSQGRRPAIWAALATLAPMLLLTVGYLLNIRPETDGFWGLSTAVFAMVYVALAGSVLQKKSVESLVVWLFIAGHFGLALAAAMVFEAASLTLAIAAQLVSLAWVIRKFEVPEIGWLFKLVVLVVITRLTFNPWLADYPTGVHWSLWTYGGSTALAAFAAYWLRPCTALSRWAEGAALHLFVLTVWSEVRYQLYDGVVYAPEFSFTEAVLTMTLSAVLGLVYYHRASLSQTLAWCYRAYAYLLAGVFVLIYGLLSMHVLLSDAWVHGEISSTPIWNALLGAFGLPVLLGFAYAKGFAPQLRDRAIQFAGVAAFVFVSLQVRHLWSGTVNLSAPPVQQGELYTYSAVWLVIAIGAMLAGSWRLGEGVYRAGLAVLAIVIAKLFLVDFSDLQGLLRVASFMGLGLSLLGVAYLHQRLTGNKAGSTVET